MTCRSVLALCLVTNQGWKEGHLGTIGTELCFEKAPDPNGTAVRSRLRVNRYVLSPQAKGAWHGRCVSAWRCLKRCHCVRHEQPPRQTVPKHGRNRNDLGMHLLQTAVPFVPDPFLTPFSQGEKMTTPYRHRERPSLMRSRKLSPSETCSLSSQIDTPAFSSAAASGSATSALSSDACEMSTSQGIRRLPSIKLSQRLPHQECRDHSAGPENGR